MRLRDAGPQATLSRRLALALAAPTALLAGLAFAPAAGAVVYCVPNDAVHTSCDAGQGQATVQAALTAAGATDAVADTVRIGPGTFSEQNLVYTDGLGTDELDIVGSGTGLTTVTIPDTTGSVDVLYLDGFAGTSVSALTVRMPANDPVVADTGLRLFNEARAFDLVVDGPGVSNMVGVAMNFDTELDDSVIDVPFGGGNFGVRQAGGSPAVTDSSIHADIGVSHSDSGSITTIERSTIEASLTGATVDAGTIQISNSIVDLGANDSAVGLDASNFNPGADPKTINADHVTIAGGGLTSIGFRVQATAPTATQTSTGTLTNSVISGPQTPIRRQADNNGAPAMDSQANVTVGYSNYDDSAVFDMNGADGAGAIAVTPIGTQTNHPPGFVDAPGGDFHLAPGSMLLDLGDPIAPAMGALDLEGDARALDASFDCSFVQRRDIGADEFAGVTQGTPAGCNPPPGMTPLTPANPSNPVNPTTKPKCKKRKKKKKSAAGAAKKRKRCKR